MFMAVHKINGDLYVGSTGKQLKDISNKGGCTLRCVGDFRMNILSGWEQTKIPFDYMLSNSNTDLFEYYNNGIRIKKAGYYMISLTLNFDGDGNTYSAIINVSGSSIIISDQSECSGMSNIHALPIIVYCEANAIIFGAIRHETPIDNVLCRGARSALTVVSV